MMVARSRSKSVVHHMHHTSSQLSSLLAHLFFSMEGPIAWSFVLFLGGLGAVEPPFQYGKAVCVLSLSGANILICLLVDRLT
jgi:hypothetical protein